MWGAVTIRQAEFNLGGENTLPPSIKQLSGDRNLPEQYEKQFASSRFDVVIDMICFTPPQAG